MPAKTIMELDDKVNVTEDELKKKLNRYNDFELIEGGPFSYIVPCGKNKNEYLARYGLNTKNEITSFDVSLDEYNSDPNKKKSFDRFLKTLNCKVKDGNEIIRGLSKDL